MRTEQEARSGAERAWRGVLALQLTAWAGIAALSLRQPLFADDLAAASVIREHPGVLGLLKYNYFTWSGREIGTAFGLLAFTHRAVYAALVGLAFLSAAWLIGMIGTGGLSGWRSRRALFVPLSLAILWFGMPALGETTIWLSGSTVYLMTLPLMLGFLLPFRTALVAHAASPARQPLRTVAASAGMAILGLALGMTHESAIAGTTIALVVMLAVLVRERRLRTVPGYLWAGALGFVGGVMLLLAAPGNSARMDAVSSLPSGGLGRLGYFALVLVKGAGQVLPSALPWLLLAGLLCAPALLSPAPRGERRTPTWPLVWLAGFGGSLLPFAIAPNAGDPRIYTFAFAFLALAALSVFDGRRASLLESLPRRVVSLGAAALLVVMLGEIGYSLAVQQNLRSDLASRERSIAEQRAEDRRDVVVPPLITQPHRVVPYRDITVDADASVNKLFAQWYGVDSIRLGE